MRHAKGYPKSGYLDECWQVRGAGPGRGRASELLPKLSKPCTTTPAETGVVVEIDVAVETGAAAN